MYNMFNKRFDSELTQGKWTCEGRGPDADISFHFIPT